MVNLTEIIAFLNTVAPQDLKEDYDNVGLLIGDEEKKVHTVLVSLDADESVAKEAQKKEADLVLTHHPLIFKPLKRVTNDDSISRTVVSLIKNDIALFSMHTNFDSVKDGLGDLFLDKLCETKNRTTIEGDGENGIGRFANLSCPKALCDLLQNVKQQFSLSSIRYVGDENKKIETIAVCNGGGAEFVYRAKELGADCYVSGDIKYQHARFAYENDIALIEIPHFAAENIFVDFAASLLKEKFGDALKVVKTQENIDVWKQYE